MTSTHHDDATHLANSANECTLSDGHPATGTALATEALARAVLAVNSTLRELLAPPATPFAENDSGSVGEPALAELRAVLGYGKSSTWRRCRIQQLVDARDHEVRRQWAGRIEETGRAKGWSTWASAYINPDIDFTDTGMPSTESLVAELRRSDRTAILREVRHSLLGEDGNELDDDTQISAGAFRRVLSELETEPVQADARDSTPAAQA